MQDICRYIVGNLLGGSTSWDYGGMACCLPPRPRKANGAVPGPTQSLGTRQPAVWVSAWVWRPGSQGAEGQGQEKKDVPGEKDRATLPFLCLFVLFRSSVDWTMPTHTGEYSLLIQVLIYSRNTLTNTLKNDVLLTIWASRRPVKLT